MAEEYFKLFFDHNGNLQDSANQAAIIDALVSSPSSITDLWIFSYGWDNDLTSGTATYNTWVANMREVQREKVKDPAYNPLFVGIYWPSKGWADNIIPQPTRTPEAQNEAMVEGGGEGEFEMGEASPVQPTSDPVADIRTEYLNRFVVTYRPIMDPEDIYGDDYDRDFRRLHALMSQPQPPTDQDIREFVKILKKYQTPDPHSDPIEKQNIGNAPVEVIVNQLKENEAALSEQFEAFSVRGILQKLFGVSTFWKMKGRAAIVGENGAYNFLLDVKKALHQHKQRVRIHLLGHSFGAKLVTAAVYRAAEAHGIERPLVDTLVLLLGAFSQFSFSGSIPVTTEVRGYYTSVVERGVVANPIIAIYSQHDTANKVFYPLGMKFAMPASRYEMGELDETQEMYRISTNRFGSIGANGAQGLDIKKYRAIPMLSRNGTYDWGDLADISCLNVDGQQFIRKKTFVIGAHNDLDHYEIFHGCGSFFCTKEVVN